MKPIHGHSSSGGRRPPSPTYSSWHAMIGRCHRPWVHDYARYGGKGIAVCDRWRKFALFLEDMGPRPEGTQIDRIDCARGYEPGNCRWATPKQNARNKTSNNRITACGRTLTLVEWSEVSGINAMTIQSRLARGWPPERAIFCQPKTWRLSHASPSL